MSDAAGSVEVEVRAALAPFQRGMRQAERETRAFDTRAQRAFTGTQRAVATMTAGVHRAQAAVFSLRGALLGLGAGLFLRRAVTTIREFETQMAGVGAVTSATGQQMEAMTAQARELGATTVFAASEAAGGMEFLGRAGFETQQIMAAMPGTLDLAAAGSLELSRAADIASNTLQAFNMQADEMGRASDVLAAAAASANTNIDQLAQGLGHAAPIAAGFGVSIEETVAALGTLSNAGIQAGRAGTGLRRVLTELGSPSDDLREMMGGLTLEADGLQAVMEQLADAGVTTAEAMEFFGQRGGPAFSVMLRGARNTRELTGALNDAEGEAARLAEERLGPMERAMRELNSATEELMLSMGEGGLADAVAHVAAQMTEFARSDDAVVLAERLGGAMKVLADNTDIVVTSVGALIGLRIGGIWGAAIGAIVAYNVQLTRATEVTSAHADALRAATDAMRDAHGLTGEAAESARQKAQADIQAGIAALQRAEAELALAEALAAQDVERFGPEGRLLGADRGLDTLEGRVDSIRAALEGARNEMLELATDADAFDSRGLIDFGALPIMPGSRDRTGAGGAGGAAQAEMDHFQQTIQMIHDRTEAIRLEQDVMGQSVEVQERMRAQQELMNAAREAEIPLTRETRDLIDQLAEGYGRAAQELDDLEEATHRAEQAQREFERAASHAVSSFVRDIRNGENAVDALTNAVDRLAMRLIDMALDDAIQGLFGNLGSLFGGVAGGGGGGLFLGSGIADPRSLLPSAKGNVFAGGHVEAFAQGGVVTRPTLFPMANGAGLMGEAGPEAIMPLRHGPDGRLGVEAGGGSSGINVNVNLTQIPGATADVRQRDDGNLDVIVRMVEGRMAESIQRGGQLGRAMQNAYGLRRSLR